MLVDLECSPRATLVSAYRGGVEIGVCQNPSMKENDTLPSVEPLKGVLTRPRVKPYRFGLPLQERGFDTLRFRFTGTAAPWGLCQLNPGLMPLASAFLLRPDRPSASANLLTAPFEQATASPTS